MNKKNELKEGPEEFLGTIEEITKKALEKANKDFENIVKRINELEKTKANIITELQKMLVIVNQKQGEITAYKNMLEGV